MGISALSLGDWRLGGRVEAGLGLFQLGSRLIRLLDNVTATFELGGRSDVDVGDQWQAGGRGSSHGGAGRVVQGRVAAANWRSAVRPQANWYPFCRRAEIEIA